jgi:alkanesulfonate monooxygenase SsuD/methylene tetrahydromethanopterin reductase-like flavin-dependent oxidoreductase (luciferase family)
MIAITISSLTSGSHRQTSDTLCSYYTQGTLDERTDGSLAGKELLLFIGYFSEHPYQDRSKSWYGKADAGFTDLSLSNGEYDPVVGADLWDRYMDETMFIEEMGFDGVMGNEHHATPLTMRASTNIEAAMIARITKKLKIVLLGNVLPLWEPMWLAEQLAMIDVISRGRLVAGWVRGTGRESVAHNAPPAYNWERYQEAHVFIIRAWTEDGPFRHEGDHFQYRYVNPWVRPYQQDPHPQIWIPGVLSKSTMEWAAARRFPYVGQAIALEPTKRSFDYYEQLARDAGWEAGTQHRVYTMKVHVDETEQLAYDTARKLLEGPSNIFIEGSRGAKVNPVVMNLPGLVSRTNVLPTAEIPFLRRNRGLDKAAQQAPVEQTAPTRESDEAERKAMFDRQLDGHLILTGTPDSILPKIRYVLEYLRPGSVIFWDGDGDQTHDDAMRSLRLMGEYVLPAVREMGKELELFSSFEVDPYTNRPVGERAVRVGAPSA